MRFASINPTNPRTNPWNFHKKILRIGDFEKCTFFESAILNFFFQKKIFFCFFPMKISQSLLVSKDGSKFWSSQMWRHFLTHAKHFDGECNSPSYVERGGEAQLKVIISSGEAKAKRRAAAAIWGRKVRKDWLIKDHFLYIRTIVPPYFMYKVHTAGLSECRSENLKSKLWCPQFFQKTNTGTIFTT